MANGNCCGFPVKAGRRRTPSECIHARCPAHIRAKWVPGTFERQLQSERLLASLRAFWPAFMTRMWSALESGAAADAAAARAANFAYPEPPAAD